MNGPVHFNPKWGVLSVLFFGLIFFLMGFGGILIERQNLLSDTVRYLGRAGNFTALKESIKGLNSEDAIPVGSINSRVKLVFCYPATLQGIFEQLKTRWSMEYDNFSKIFFYPIPDSRNWNSMVYRYLNQDPGSIFLGYRPVFGHADRMKIIKYQLYLRIPTSFMNSLPEELIYNSLKGKAHSNVIERDMGTNGPAFELTWEQAQNSLGFNYNDAVKNLPQPVTDILSRINMQIYSGVTLH